MKTQDAAAQSPAALFISLWRDAASWSGPERAAATPVDGNFADWARRTLLQNDEAAVAYNALSGMIGHGCSSPADFKGQALAILRAIDEAFYLVHPRGVAAPAASGVRSAMPRWLRDCRDRRTLQGAYLQDQDLVLTARGPLLRGERHPIASSADSLADRFAALTVAPAFLDQDGRRISLQFKYLSPSIARGIPPGAKTGAEVVACIPIAEDAEDIVGSERRSADQLWVDFRPQKHVDPPRRIIDALCAAGTIDVAMAPEFMVSEVHADALAQALALVPTAFRLLVAGSGATTPTTDTQAWNEARALNGSGVELWRQRKLWPAGIDGPRARSFGVAEPDPGSLAYEDTAAGDCLTIVDADGLGRCIILICQDLEAQRIAADAISYFQPDWIFVPLLDSGVGEDRWMHRRAFELSARSQSRFVFVSSTGLAAKAGYTNPACGLAVGPLAPSENAISHGDMPRAFQTAAASSTGSARFAIIRWREGRWLTSKLSAN